MGSDPHGHDPHPHRHAHDHGGHDHGGHAHGGHDHGGRGHDHHEHGHGDHNHGFGHAHVHVPAGGDPRRALAVALALNGAYFVVEAAAGWWTGSLALLSDAAHMASDVGALLLAIGAAQLALRPMTPDQTFGWRRAEVLGSFVNGLLLVAAAAWIVSEAAERLMVGPPAVPALPMAVVATIGLLINLAAAVSLARSGHDDLNVRGALVHMLADALGSLGAMVAAAFVALGYPIADPLVSGLVAALVVWGAVNLLGASGRVLLQLPPRGFDVRRLRAAMAAVPGVTSVHELHVWTLDGRSPIVTAHLVAADADLDGVRRAVAATLEQGFNASHTTLQVERGGAPCGADEGCGG